MTDPVVQKKSLNPKTKIILISLLVLISVCLFVSVFFIYSTLSYDRVYKGVFINDINISQMTFNDVCDSLKLNYAEKSKNLKIVLNDNGVTAEVDLSKIDLKYEIEEAAQKAFDVGRKGNIFARLSEILKSSREGVRLNLDYSYNPDKVNEIIDDFYSRTLVSVKEANLSVQDNKVSLTIGHPGKAIDKEKALEIINNSIKTCTGGTFDVPVTTIMPKAIDVDDIYNQIAAEPVDATVTVENNNVKVIPHEFGREISKSELEGIIKENENSIDKEILLPVKFTQPKITTDEVNSKLFKDVLATSSTSFSTSGQNNYNRGVNIGVAASKINGKILAPGEVFSFNNVVGPRTVGNGFKIAKEYVNGKIVDGVGGGVCQVSSTLYSAVLFADLETIERQNHMFTVSYIPLGRDAAVAYNELDFKFKNNTNWPVKIVSNVKNNTISFTIYGTKEEPGKTIEIKHVQVGSKPSPVKYIDDPNLEEGQTVVVQSGYTGYTVDTYKIVKINGNIVSNDKIHRSTYVPYETIIKRGTKKAAKATETHSPAPPTAISPTSEPTPQPTLSNEIIDETLVSE
ncbi:VanW family protein [Acetivibrio straminisolvens]|jgi:vancomycin resistance protein YoaR|uniref:Vancomycin B-type resistance protein VanW n=1 Tax=Acetivibrio straminisolvens JCM 21531 TaxID=1294263 RepID=W4V935_9FIRM|nr:VanW family protein [Acetivibrio straminisolvens]GAE89269.1 vancomycin B-type resistance protein VanW [Acetivibrio straminisolvens JCM 21531]